MNVPRQKKLWEDQSSPWTMRNRLHWMHWTFFKPSCTSTISCTYIHTTMARRCSGSICAVSQRLSSEYHKWKKSKDFGCTIKFDKDSFPEGVFYSVLFSTQLFSVLFSIILHPCNSVFYSSGGHWVACWKCQAFRMFCFSLCRKRKAQKPLPIPQPRSTRPATAAEGGEHRKRSSSVSSTSSSTE